ncbi:MAG TPA: hypothetical protein VK590_14625, partial [Saprospiraceae bacterium]|nr:hypothetical protein [Saprospiraceae bacterium]
RINSIIAKVKRFDTTSPRGWRNVTTGIQQSGGKEALSGFDFNPFAPMDKLLKKKYTLDTEEGTLNIISIIPYSQFDYPKNAEKAMLQLYCTNIDWLTSISNTTSSEATYISLDNTPQDINISLSSIPEGSGVNIFVLKLVYYDELNGKQNLFNNQEYKSAKIIAVE